MDNNAGVLRWELEVVKDKFTAALATSLTQAKGFGKELEKIGKIDFGSGIRSSLDDLNSFGDRVVQAAAVTTALGTALGGVFIKSAADLQKTSASFQVLIGNVEVANELFGRLARFANTTPFEFPQIAKGAQTLLGFGVQARDVETVLRQLGDIAGATGGDLNALTLVAGQIFAQGKIQAQDFYQIINSGAGALGPLIAKNLGVNGVGALREEFEKGTVTAQAFFDALRQATLQGGFAFEGTDKLAQTFSGRLATLKDDILELGRNLIGVKLDDRLGLVVQPGGVFDQLTQVIPKISAAAAVLGPVLQQAFSVIIQNGPAVISTIAAIGAAFLAFKALGAGLSLISALASPVTLALGALAVLLGVVVFNAAQKLQGKLGEVFGSFAEATKTAKDAANANIPIITSQQQALRAETDKLGLSIARANRDYKQSLADIVRTHGKAMQDIQRQTAEEVDSFEIAQNRRAVSFAKAEANMDRAHSRTTGDLQKEIDSEIRKGRLGDRARIADLKFRLQQENEDFARSKAEREAEFQEETVSAQAEHQKRLDAFQAQLNEELAFQKKHAQELRDIKATDALDDVQRLKQSHDDQIASFNDQQKQIESRNAASTVIQANDINKIPSLINKNLFSGLGKDLGKDIGNALKQSLFDALIAIPGQIISLNAKVIDEINKMTKDAFKFTVGANPVFAGFDLLAQLGKKLKIPGFSNGVQNFGGGLAVVGERGPELVELPGGSTVHSNQESMGMMGGNTTINVNLSGIHTRSRSDVRELGKEFIGAVNDELRARGFAEIGNGALSGVALRG